MLCVKLKTKKQPIQDTKGSFVELLYVSMEFSGLVAVISGLSCTTSQPKKQ